MGDEKRCKGITKKNGERCKFPATRGDYCGHHDSQNPALTTEEKLSPREKAFVDHYMACGFNASEAARRTSPDAADSSARQRGYVLAHRPHVKAEIEKRMQSEAMSADETLARLTHIGRGNLGLFLDEEGHVDLTMPSARANLHLIKKITRDQYGRIKSIELHDSKDALKVFTKVHSLVSDRVEHSGTVQHRHAAAYDYSVLTDDELDTLQTLVDKLEATIDEDG